MTAGELTRDEISKGEEDPDYRLKMAVSKVKIPEIKTKKRPRYTPLSRRQDRPNAVLWLLRNHGELKDSQIMRLVGTTKPTIQQIRDRTHWNSANLAPQDPVTLGLCSQIDLDTEVEKAAKRVEKERRAMGLPVEAGATLLPTAETTGYEIPGTGEQPDIPDEAPSAANVFGNISAPAPDAEKAEEADEAARVFAKLQGLTAAGDEAEAEAEADAEAVAGAGAEGDNLAAAADDQPDEDAGAEDQPDEDDKPV